MNERKTISQYLEEDLNVTYSPKSSKSTLNHSRVNRRRERGRRLSLDPTTKIKVEKLEVVRITFLDTLLTRSEINMLFSYKKTDQSFTRINFM